MREALAGSPHLVAPAPADEMVLQHGPPKVPLSWVPLHPFTKQVLTQNTWLDVVHPSQLPFSWPRRPKLSMPHALLWELTFQDNYGHMLGEHGPIMHTVLCAYLGRWAAEAGSSNPLHFWSSTEREHAAFMRNLLCARLGRWRCLVFLRPMLGSMCPACTLSCVSIWTWGSGHHTVAWPRIVTVCIAVPGKKRSRAMAAARQAVIWWPWS